MLMLHPKASKNMLCCTGEEGEEGQDTKEREEREEGEEREGQKE
jgi:hypothetical protein